MATVTFVDATTSGARDEAWVLAVAEERLSLRELLRRRVYREAAEQHAARGRRGWFRRQAGRVGPEERFEQAVRDFGRNGFVVLVGDRQLLGLDEEVDLPPGTEVTFLRLVPLVGG